MEGGIIMIMQRLKASEREEMETSLENWFDLEVTIVFNNEVIIERLNTAFSEYLAEIDFEEVEQMYKDHVM